MIHALTILIWVLLGFAIAICAMIMLHPFWIWVQNMQGKVLIKTSKKLIEESSRIATEVAELEAKVNLIKSESNGTGVN